MRPSPDHPETPLETPLEVKEGVILDAAGNELTQTPRYQNQYTEFKYTRAGHQQAQGRVYIWKGGNWLGTLLLIPLVVLLLTVGVTLFAGFIAVGVASWVIYKVLRALFSGY